MINEFELGKILTNNNNNFKLIKKIKSYKTFFGSPLKKFIRNIYNQFEIPMESFYISNFVFSSIIIALKLLLDDTFNIKLMCEILSLNYNNYKNIELILLKGLDWNISINNNDYLNFKMNLAHYTDLYQKTD